MKKIFFILLCIYFAGCSEEKIKPQVNNFLNKQELPTQESKNFKMLFSDLGMLKAVLYAKDAKVFENKKETILESVKIDFFSDKEVKTSTLTSKKGRVDDLTKDMYAIDSVVAVSDSGVTLVTDELMWRNKDRKIVSDKFVTILTPKEKIQGYGFESDQSLHNYVIFKPTVITNFEASKDTLK
jgi:LPS export ABC transporter protein LptC